MTSSTAVIYETTHGVVTYIYIYIIRFIYTRTYICVYIIYTHFVCDKGGLRWIFYYYYKTVYRTDGCVRRANKRQ